MTAAFDISCDFFLDVLVKIRLDICLQTIHMKYLALFTVKPVLNGHSKIDKTEVSKTNGSLMKVESISECSLGAFCNTFDLH